MQNQVLQFVMLCICVYVWEDSLLEIIGYYALFLPKQTQMSKLINTETKWSHFGIVMVSHRSILTKH